MWELERFNSVKLNARRMFPQHIEITLLAFNRAKFRYFSLLKPMEISNKISFFNNTYYSFNGVCWFILDDYRYFSIHTDPGSIVDCNYYGSTKCNF